MRKPTSRTLLILWILLSLVTAIPVGLAESELIFIDEGILDEADSVDELMDEIDLSTIGIQRGTEVVVASPIAMNGQFGTEMWGNNSADMDVRAILHGYETVCMTTKGFSINETVITGIRTAQGSDGSVVYTMQFAEGLCYNDGTPITARDYAFYFLLSGAPQIEAIGGTTLGMKHIAGYEAYQAGKTNVLSGVRVLSDTLIEIRVTGVSYPYFYGIALLNAKPLPITAIAPGCSVADDGEGVYIAGGFTAELLQETLLDPQTGYQYFPKVTSGAYTLESYDRQTNEARFVVNENFAGNYEGQIPHIERIVFRHVTEDDMLDDLVEGKVDLLNKVTDGTAVARALELASEHNARAIEQGREEDTISIAQGSYLRTGFGFLAFACESSPTDSIAVRRAIAMSFDKDAFVEEAMPGSALRTYGYYGMGQWMASYSDEAEETVGVEPLIATEELSKLDVAMDLAGATALLEADGWTLNERGEPYASGKDAVRYREQDGVLKPLTVRLALTEGNQVAAQLRDVLSQALPALGINLLITEMPFPQLLDHYYRQTEREYDMIFLASNFSYIFDPYYDFNTDEVYQGIVNTSGLRDEKLMGLARDMRETEPQDLRGYVKKWLAFQEKFVELMPMVPLYSNVYFDLSTADLEGYNINGISNWSSAIMYAYMRNHESVAGDI